MKAWWLRVRIVVAQWLTGYRIVPPTAWDALGRGIGSLQTKLRTSGHLSWRYHVRRNMEIETDRMAETWHRMET